MIMNTQSPSLYQRVIDKTKGLAFQSQFIAQNVDKKKIALSMANPDLVSILMSHISEMLAFSLPLTTSNINTVLTLYSTGWGAQLLCSTGWGAQLL